MSCPFRCKNTLSVVVISTTEKLEQFNLGAIHEEMAYHGLCNDLPDGWMSETRPC
jgi:hypothetical protein